VCDPAADALLAVAKADAGDLGTRALVGVAETEAPWKLGVREAGFELMGNLLAVQGALSGRVTRCDALLRGRILGDFGGRVLGVPGLNNGVAWATDRAAKLSQTTPVYLQTVELFEVEPHESVPAFAWVSMDGGRVYIVRGTESYIGMSDGGQYTLGLMGGRALTAEEIATVWGGRALWQGLVRAADLIDWRVELGPKRLRSLQMMPNGDHDSASMIPVESGLWYWWKGFGIRGPPRIYCMAPRRAIQPRFSGS
jgi:hypothetical protein